MVKFIEMGPWPGIAVGFCTDEKSFKAEMKRRGITDYHKFIGDGCAARCHYLRDDGYSLIIICFRNDEKTVVSEKAGLIAHEALHVVQYMRDQFNNGNPFDNECEAYLVQYVVYLCLEFLK